MAETLRRLMNAPMWCAHCRIVTRTVEWVCVICHLSKPAPDAKELDDLEQSEDYDE